LSLIRKKKVKKSRKEKELAKKNKFNAIKGLEQTQLYPGSSISTHTLER